MKTPIAERAHQTFNHLDLRNQIFVQHWQASRDDLKNSATSRLVALDCHRLRVGSTVFALRHPCPFSNSWKIFVLRVTSNAVVYTFASLTASGVSEDNYPERMCRTYFGDVAQCCAMSNERLFSRSHCCCLPVGRHYIHSLVLENQLEGICLELCKVDSLRRVRI